MRKGWPHRLTVRTLGSQSGNRGSIPREVTSPEVRFLALATELCGNANWQELIQKLELSSSNYRSAGCDPSA